MLFKHKSSPVVLHILDISGERRIFFRGDKVTFLDFFPVQNMLFRRNLSILVGKYPKQILVVSKSDKVKIGPLLIFIHFSFQFQFSTSFLLIFPSFPLHFPFLPCPSFPGRSAKISGEKCQDSALLSPACYATARHDIIPSLTTKVTTAI